MAEPAGDGAAELLFVVEDRFFFPFNIKTEDEADEDEDPFPSMLFLSFFLEPAIFEI